MSSEAHRGKGLRIAVVQIDRPENGPRDDDVLRAALMESQRILLRSHDGLAKATVVPPSGREQIGKALYDLGKHVQSILGFVEKGVYEDGSSAKDPLWDRIKASTHFSCRRLAQVIVFPELSIPARPLPKIDQLSRKLGEERDLLVVAGSQYADEQTKEFYRQIGVNNWLPTDERGCCPVFRRESNNSQWSLVPKVAASDLKRIKGKHWIPSADGWEEFTFLDLRVLTCSDFIQNNAQEFYQPVLEKIKNLSVILVPALTRTLNIYEPLSSHMAFWKSRRLRKRWRTWQFAHLLHQRGWKKKWHPEGTCSLQPQKESIVQDLCNDYPICTYFSPQSKLSLGVSDRVS